MCLSFVDWGEGERSGTLVEVRAPVAVCSSSSESGGGSPVSSSQLSSSSDQVHPTPTSPVPSAHSDRRLTTTPDEGEAVQGYRSQEERRSSRQSGGAGRRTRNASLKGILRSSHSEANLRRKPESEPEPEEMGMGSTELTAEELYQIKLMFSGKGTEVVVAGCLANLYFAKKTATGKVSWTEENRELKATGVPVLVLDKGEARARASRRLHVILAERGTGFLLWRDTIDALSQYKEMGRSFHTMFLSTNHDKQAG